jgi:hypothetical protein
LIGRPAIRAFRRADRVAPEASRVRGDLRGARFRSATFPVFDFSCCEAAGDGRRRFFFVAFDSRRLF